MNRLPLLLSIVAVVIAVVALGLAILLPGPQGPKGDTGPQGIQGSQGPASSLSVHKGEVPLIIGNSGAQSVPLSIQLDAGDVLQGDVWGFRNDVEYVVRIYMGAPPETPEYLQHRGTLGSGYGGTAFCYVADNPGTYSLVISVTNSSFISHYSLSGSEPEVVWYWVQAGNTTQAQ
jgi:hypothetical protein